MSTAAEESRLEEKLQVQPERAKSAYFFWLHENRERIAIPGLSLSEVCKSAGAEWNAIEDKSKWETLADEDKVRFERESAAYNSSSTAPSAYSASPAQEDDDNVEDPNLPKLPYTSAYRCWFEENLARIKQPGMSDCDLVRQASMEWASLKDKSKWVEMAQEDRNRYVIEMAAYRAENPEKKDNRCF